MIIRGGLVDMLNPSLQRFYFQNLLKLIGQLPLSLQIGFLSLEKLGFA